MLSNMPPSLRSISPIRQVLSSLSPKKARLLVKELKELKELKDGILQPPKVIASFSQVEAGGGMVRGLFLRR